MYFFLTIPPGFHISILESNNHNGVVHVSFNTFVDKLTSDLLCVSLCVSLSLCVCVCVCYFIGVLRTWCHCEAISNEGELAGQASPVTN